jgi:ankyrin repeat protein
MSFSNFAFMKQMIKKKPALLTKKIRGFNLWQTFGNWPSYRDEEFEMVALWAMKYLKGFSGGYDSFFLAQDDYGDTALQIAIRLSHKGLAERLLKIYEKTLEGGGLTAEQIQKKVSAFVNMPGFRRKTVMHMLNYGAKEILDLDTVEFFVSKGANLNLLDDKGDTPSDIWCMLVDDLYHDDKPIDAFTAFNFIRIVVERGIDPYIENKNGDALISIAEKYTIGWTKKYSTLLREIYHLCLKKDHNLKCRAENEVATSTSVSTLALSKEDSKDEATDSETQELAKLFTAIETNDIDYIKRLLEKNQMF